jgi:hypothetical protein
VSLEYSPGEISSSGFRDLASPDSSPDLSHLDHAISQRHGTTTQHPVELSSNSYKMDPHRNFALHNAKLQHILQTQNNISTSRPTSETEDMPAPPAYDTVVDPGEPIPNVRSPYDLEEEDDKDDDETPEITINAATQVRGNGNIISIAQMDSVRIANLIAIMLHGGKVPEPTSPPQPQPGQRLPSLASLSFEPKPARQYPKINITVNCGATVIGDRNIVGPGLGDIARQMQVAQRNQALQAQQQTAQNLRTSPTTAVRETLYQAQAAHGLFTAQAPTPPMSRSSSRDEGSGGVKRKAGEETKESVTKRRC